MAPSNAQLSSSLQLHSPEVSEALSHISSKHSEILDDVSFGLAQELNQHQRGGVV
jgi:hypothetical protein